MMTDGPRGGTWVSPRREWIVPEWAAPPEVVAFTTTRKGPEGVANLDARGAAGDPAFTRVLAPLLPATPVWPQQQHGITVATVTPATLDDLRAHPPRADALVTTLAAVPLAVRHADCLPILLSAADGSVIAAVHAGWRGLAAGIVEATIAAMGAAVDSNGVALVAWLGPAIGPAAFEVGPDVLEAFGRQGRPAMGAFAAAGPGKWRADLYLLARQRLARCGITAIAGGGLCTVTDVTRFFSHRRDRDPRRMATVIYRTQA